VPEGGQPYPAPAAGAGAKPPMVPPGSTAPATMAPDSQGLRMRGTILVTPAIKLLEKALALVGSQSPDGQALVKAIGMLGKAFGTASPDLSRAEMKLAGETASPVTQPNSQAVAQRLKAMNIGGGAPAAPQASPTPEPAGMAGAA